MTVGVRGLWVGVSRQSVVAGTNSVADQDADQDQPALDVEPEIRNQTQNIHNERIVDQLQNDPTGDQQTNDKINVSLDD